MKLTISLLLLALGCVGFYLLYCKGYVVTQVKTAVKYIESNKGTKASFSHCNGFTRRRVSFDEDKMYHFEFSPELTQGQVSAEILDAEKNSILCLSNTLKSADLPLERRGKYYLEVRFKSAAGKYALSWE